MADVTFRFDRAPTGELSGESLVEQTEEALSGLGQSSSHAEEEAARAVEIATEANTKSDQAVTTAGQAQTTANSALTTAQSAQTSANQAVQTAQSAVTTAQGASQTAQNAVSTAQSAVTAAQSAQTAAENAESRASTSASAAEGSANSASAAQTAAQTAQTDADNAAALATQAQSAAAASAQAAETAAQSVSASARQIGEIVSSTLPLSTAGLHLLDGALLVGDGIYSAFVDYIAGLYENDPTAAFFTDETTWQSSVTQYGVCGKFVYDSVNETVRLPKITGIVEGTTDLTALGDLVQAGLPNITGTIGENDTIYRTFAYPDKITGAFSGTKSNNYFAQVQSTDTNGASEISFDASRSSPIYGNSSTVQPQTIKCLVYIVIATVTKTDIQVDIDNIVTDLNSKVDIASPQTITGNKNFTGALQHNGYGVESVIASGSNYIRYDSGLQICWGSSSIATTSATDAVFPYSGAGYVNFPVPFSSAPICFANPYEYSAYWSASVTGVTETRLRLAMGGYQANTKRADYLAIGYWK